MALALPTGSTFAPATQQVVKLNFMVASSAKGSFPISFASGPAVQDVADANANSLPVKYISGTVALTTLVPTGSPVLTLLAKNGN